MFVLLVNNILDYEKTNNQKSDLEKSCNDSTITEANSAIIHEI